MRKFKNIEILKNQIETNQNLKDILLNNSNEFIAQTATAKPLIDKTVFKLIIFIIGRS